MFCAGCATGRLRNIESKRGGQAIEGKDHKNTCGCDEKPWENNEKRYQKLRETQETNSKTFF